MEVGVPGIGPRLVGSYFRLPAALARHRESHRAAFAMLRGLLSEHKQVELKRIVVRTPNEGIGRELLTEVAGRAFGEYSAHRLFLDVFVTNDRARHVYENFGFRKEGIMRDAVYRDGAYHSLVLMSLLETEYRCATNAPAQAPVKPGGTNE